MNPAVAAADGYRARYLAYIRSEYATQNAYANRLAGVNDSGQEAYARREAFFYRVTGDEEHARRTMAFLRRGYRYHSEGKGRNEPVREIPVQAAQAYAWVRHSNQLSSADHTLVRDYLLLLDRKHQRPWERGAMNRSMAAATGRKMLTVLFPDAPGNEERRAYAEGVWKDWWTYRDTSENSIHYNGIWWSYVDAWLTFTKEDALYRDREVRKLAERYLEQVSPLGLLPAYGDTTGLNAEPGRWIALMEKWATVYRDGRFKWVAHRLFDWLCRRHAEMERSRYALGPTMDRLMDAYLAADDTIEPVEPIAGCAVTHRRAPVLCDNKTIREEGYIAKLTADTIPDKLVLRSGWAESDFYALMELCPPSDHGHIDTGSINLMTGSGSVLLGDTAYLVKHPQFHNCFQLDTGRPRKMQPFLFRATKTEEPLLKEGALAAMCHVHISNYMAEHASLDRRLFFVKNKLLWVQDTLTANDAIEARVGPAWQTMTVSPKRGASWCNTRLTSIPVSDVYKLQHVQEWSNTPWDLLLVFPPSSGAAIQLDDVSRDESSSVTAGVTGNNLKQRVWYSKTVHLRAGDSVRMNTLLIPHPPLDDSSELASGVHMELETPQSAVVRWDGPEAVKLWLGMNEDGGAINAGPVTTDAQQFLVESDSKGGVRYWVLAGTRLAIDGHQLYHSPTRRDCEEVRFNGAASRPADGA